ncbi:hypothetical protein SFUL_3724 [Streptomyces microflavus DSM 40593]|uniref:Minor tail protein n=1 Tax=Streptomyces microflavus DSM 40593 TaxID=1303692 RepID=N0D088_STRMI|nr:hypothetical protein [Streptomyces microflavus]AGK78642.1 hypothetical protein SFUL_3724 [Streptomyces microflavus DSM 40593]
MAQDSWPSPAHNNRAVTDSEYEQMAARDSDDGIYGTPDDPAVVTAGTGLTVNVRANVSAAVRGHAWTSGGTTVVLNIGANGAGQTRLDRVVLRLDRSTWTVRAVIKQGTAGGAAPPLTRNPGPTGVWEVLLATVTVPAGALSTTVTRAELYVGSRVRPAHSARLNPHPEAGEMAYCTDTDELRMWTGAKWVTTYSNPGAINVNAFVPGWATETDSVIEVRNGVVQLRLGSFQRLSTALPGETNSRLPVLIPPAYRHPVRDQYLTCYITGGSVGRVTVRSAASTEPGQVWLTQKPDIPFGRRVLTSGASWNVS